MRKGYTNEELEDFVNAIRKSAIAIKRMHPAFYMVSLNGGLPLFDIMAIIDRDINPDNAIYFPGSSKIKNSAKILTNCFENFFLEKQDETKGVRPIASLDEVVSGHSIERLFNAYNSASRKVSRALLGNSQKQREGVETESEKLRERFPLFVYGVRETRSDKKLRMNNNYLAKVKKGEVLEFPTNKIITMDDLDFQTIKFSHPDSSGFNGQGYFPKVDQIVMKRPYIELLGDIAILIGVDPYTIDPSRARVASDCEEYSRKPEYNQQRKL